MPAVTTKRRRRTAAHKSQVRAIQRQYAAEVNEVSSRTKRSYYHWKKYRYNLLAYLVENFPDSTGLSPLSPAHERAIKKLQDTILNGGQDLWVVFRGWAKSTINELAATWAAGYGHRRFIVAVGADHGAARQSLISIKSEFETNPRLDRIFPEICACARALEGIPQRASRQTWDGKLTNIEWTSAHIVLPTVGKSTGAVVKARGLTSNMRGLRFKRPDGTQVRPDFILGDDLQTDESAASPASVQKRLRIINKTVLRLGGHKRRIACTVLGTIIEPDDLIDQLSDHEQNPAWVVERVPMLESLPDAFKTLWLNEYAELRTNYEAGNKIDQRRAHREANEFYKANRAAMDRGAKPSWEYCFDDEELSAIQHAMNIAIDTGIDAFMAECQNTPVRDTGGLTVLSPAEIARKVSGYGRGLVPPECSKVTAFIDVHPTILYWRAWAWDSNFSGFLVDSGTFPDQRRLYFAHSEAFPRLQDKFPAMETSALITAGLHELTAAILGKEWTRTDGVPLRIARCMVDANGEQADAIKSFCRQSPHAAVLSPSFGRGIPARSQPISRWKQSRKLRCGPEWLPTKGRPGEPEGITFDTNYWKARFHRSLALAAGSKGALYLFKADPAVHRMAADHYHAEVPKKVSSGGREVYEFSQKPNTDNHIFDCDVGCMVAASKEGISTIPVQRRQRISLRERMRGG